MNLGIQYEHISGDRPTPPKKFHVKATGEHGTALAQIGETGEPGNKMTDGEHELRVITLLMDDTNEVRMYADNALKALE